MVNFKFDQARVGNFKSIRIKLASPDQIRSWSHGEVIKPETINYRSFKPEKDGLFCERIFGPIKDWECSCGKYKRIRYRGVICDRCGVEVIQSKVRRERLGHIELAVPVSHIWYFKALPSVIGYLLNMSVRDLERALYYESYIVIEPGETGLKQGDLVSENQYLGLTEQEDETFLAKMGAEGVRDLLATIDIERLSRDLRAQVKVETYMQKKKNLLKRLHIIEAFRQSGNRPEWMIMEVVPVLPPDLRPLVPLEGGRFATSDLNDLYRRVINRNNRLKKLIELRAPEVILRNEKRILQEAVDALFDNGRRSRAVRGQGNRALKSLSDMLKGKQGRFRQNLLGKRVDYSGRSVIVVGPELELHQCGLPQNMALELFKPFIIRRLEDSGLVQTVKGAKRLVEKGRPEVWDILEEIIKDHPILLNRAPTLHRLGIQAFYPVLIDGKAIKIHPLVCTAFNADFDGDQMAVHLPLSFESQIEARVLMLSANNILSPQNGKPLTTPNQDIVLGCYYLTKILESDVATDRLKIFRNPDEIQISVETGNLKLHEPIRFIYKGKVHRTSPGRVIFNQIIPEELGFYNHLFNKKRLGSLVTDCHRALGNYNTAMFLDKLKELGFRYATSAGITVSIYDMIVPEEKDALIQSSSEKIKEIQDQYNRGVITDGERYNKVIDTWTHTTSQVAEVMFKTLENDHSGFNPIFMMADSGARGSKEQIRQLAGMRGLMAKPQKKITGQIGEIIETPITANFREGLNVVQYFISTHGARKGLADTALKTADAGYLTRRLVDVAQDVIITEVDCDTILGIDITALKDGEDIIEPLSDRILGRFVQEDVIDPITDEILIASGEDVDEKSAQIAEDCGVDEIKIRSVLTCESRRGVCIKCYGRNLATGRKVSIGEAVGVIAAQSIGEPGTQLTLRTFHIGGAASRITAQSKVTVKHDGLIEYKNLKCVTSQQDEKIVISRNSDIAFLDNDGRIRAHYRVPYGAKMMIGDNCLIEQGESIFEWDPYSSPILTDAEGTAKFVDIIEGVTFQEELDETTGLRQRVVIDSRDRSLHPHIHIVSEAGKRLRNYDIPTGAHILVHEDDRVRSGDILVKIPREISKTRDITGGLPRVAELFEARKPKESAVVTEIDGEVAFGGIVRGLRKIVVTSELGDEKIYIIPHGKHLSVHEGDRVKAGDRLCEGPINPHDILRILGEKQVQSHLVNEIQEVYRLQGVRINDKHIEIIVRQMLQKVKIEDPGDSEFLEGDRIDKNLFREINNELQFKGQEPATARSLLLGITKASLNTESFISAASFQETTRVLTDAAIQGKRDNLLGLKENVIIGHLVPAGTGLAHYKNLKIERPVEDKKPIFENDEDNEILDEETHNFNRSFNEIKRRFAQSNPTD